MKLIPKFLKPSGGLKITGNNIFWFDDWKKVLEDSGNLSFGQTPWKSILFNNNTNAYTTEGDRGNYLESDSSYMWLVKNYIDDSGELTLNGRNWLTLNFLTNTESNPDNADMLKMLLDSVNNDYKFPQGLRRHGRILNTWKDFIIGEFNDKTNKGTGVSTDNIFSVAHNLNSGFGIYDESGRIIKRNTENPKKDFLSMMGFDKIKDLTQLDNPLFLGGALSKNEKENLRYKDNSSKFIEYRKLNFPLDTHSLNDDNKPELDDTYLEGIKNEVFTPSNQNTTGSTQGTEGDNSRGSHMDVVPPRLKRFMDEYGITDPKRAQELMDKLDTQSSPQEELNSPLWFDAIRLGLNNTFNIINTERYIDNLSVPLKNYTPIGRQIHGDYVAQQLAQNQAARLINRAPLTSNAQIESASLLDAISKGNQYIDQGNLRDSLMYWHTADLAWNQAKENILKFDDLGNYNRTQLSELNNRIALLRYNLNGENQQNTDILAGDQSKRAWSDYNYEKNKRRKNQEALETLEDSTYGVGSDSLLVTEITNKYKEAVLANSPDKEKYKRQLDLIQSKVDAQRAINKIRRIDPVNWRHYFNSMYGQRFTIGNNGIINGVTDEYKAIINDDELLKLLGWIPSEEPSTTPSTNAGSVMLVHQKGGLVRYTSSYVEDPYIKEELASGRSSRSSRSSTSSESSEDESKDKIFKSIVETIKGIDGLNSDVLILSNELLTFFDLQRYSSLTDDDPTQFYSTYIKALDRVNLIKQSAKLFDSAYKALELSGAMNQPVIDEYGRVYVGIGDTSDIKAITPQEYLLNRDRYQLLYNNQLLELRRNNPKYAFSDRIILSTAYSGTTIQKIHDYIKNIIGNIGTDSLSMDMLIRQFGNDAASGLQVLKGLTLLGLTDSLTSAIIGNMNALTELNITRRDQTLLAIDAIKTIYAALPKNMQTALLLHSGSEENAEKFITGLVFKGLSSTQNFNVNGITELDSKGMPIGGAGKSKSGSGSGGSEKEPQKDLTLVSIIRGIAGTPDRIKINKGTKSEMSIDVKNYQVEGAYNQKSLIDALTDSKLMGITDPRKIYFGDQLLPSEALSDVAYLARGFSRVFLPIKSDGSPDFTVLDRFDKVCDKLRRDGVNPIAALEDDASDTDKLKLAEALQSEGLYGLVNSSKGIPNKDNFGLFLMTEGITSSRAGIKNSDYVTLNNELADRLESILLVVNQSTGKVIRDYKLDRYNRFNPADWGSNYEKVYEGTIYIPINPDELLADNASGNKVSDSYAQQLASESQSARMISRFKDRE